MKHTILFFYLTLLILKNIGPHEESLISLGKIVERKSHMVVGIIKFFRNNIGIL